MTYEYDEKDFPVRWTEEDGTTHEMSIDGAAGELKRLFDMFPDGMNELESHMEWHNKLYTFFQEAVELTKEHDVLDDHAVVYPSKLAPALEKVDPNWHGRGQITEENRHGEAWPDGVTPPAAETKSD